MKGDGEDFMSVYISGAQQVQALRNWVRSMGWHLSGPVGFDPEDPDDTAWFVRPGRTPEEFDEMMRKATTWYPKDGD